jgi:hypothetical protein
VKYKKIQEKPGQMIVNRGINGEIRERVRFFMRVVLVRVLVCPVAGLYDVAQLMRGRVRNDRDTYPET